ncbi:5-(carboxyamino)imidazole ribonucleotide mutase [Rothia nasimurium]|uniref:5-(carboxyamino)imidazole ribonucleotide mutase n=1 Tax=Rothia nasimurium TaxID=85336 RepID=UPI002DD66FC5|nr:5-(carboxyamino)imidazole ribonucleotide mutase [Rothia nasimurium]
MTSPYDSNNPIVGIVMGSDSDWPVMEAAAEVLEEFGIPYEADVVSAHRMPEDMIAYGREAADRGIRVIIAGAGGAAHLPGMLASVTPLPVIGVPVKLKSLDGMDSLLSIVQMPAGVPVATVSINGARNAGLLALRILGSGSDGFAHQVRADLVDFATSLRQTAMDKGAALRAKVEEHKAELDKDAAPRPTQAATAPAHNDEQDGQQKTPYAP